MSKAMTTISQGNLERIPVLRKLGVGQAVPCDELPGLRWRKTARPGVPSVCLPGIERAQTYCVRGTYGLVR